LRDKHGRIVRWFGTNTDISEQQATAEALAEEKRHLETLNRTAALVAADGTVASPPLTEGDLTALSSGRLKGLVDLRDTIIPAYSAQLDAIAAQFQDLASYADGLPEPSPEHPGELRADAIEAAQPDALAEHCRRERGDEERHREVDRHHVDERQAAHRDVEAGDLGHDQDDADEMKPQIVQPEGARSTGAPDRQRQGQESRQATEREDFADGVLRHQPFPERVVGGEHRDAEQHPFDAG
jgi:hypothetical protein